MAFRTNPQTGQVERALQEVTANGTVLSGKKIDPIVVSNTL